MSQLWWNWPPKTFGQRTHIEAGLEPHHQAGGCEEEEESHVAAIVMFIMRQSCGKDPVPTAGFHRKQLYVTFHFTFLQQLKLKDLLQIEIWYSERTVCMKKRRRSLISWVLAFIFIYFFQIFIFLMQQTAFMLPRSKYRHSFLQL